MTYILMIRKNNTSEVSRSYLLYDTKAQAEKVKNKILEEDIRYHSIWVQKY